MVKAITAAVVLAIVGGLVVLALLTGSVDRMLNGEEGGTQEAPAPRDAAPDGEDVEGTPSPTPDSTATPVPNATSSPTPPAPSPEGPPAPGAPPFFLNLTITEFPSEDDEVRTMENFTFNWTVETSDDRSVIMASTAVYWSNQSANDTEAPPSNATNRSGFQENATAPANFSTNVKVEHPGTVFLRAHAEHNGSHFWSEEVSVEVTADVETVDITPGLDNARFFPQTLNLRLGDGVEWNNQDVTTHTATSSPGAPANFSTGNISAGSVSDVVYFTKPGRYDYFCEIHPNMTGAIVVEED